MKVAALDDSGSGRALCQISYGFAGP